ncbi:MAG: hypothetical protein M3N30_10725 [Bacteroidota bacterium]|nr:hypothetical protein [Bacteroidota bacterium]
MDREEPGKLARRIAYLIYSFIVETISEEENNKLDEWVCARLQYQKLFEELTDPVFLAKCKLSIQNINDLLHLK